MKVHAVSYSFSGTQGKIKRESDIPYLYTLDLAKMESKEKAHKRGAGKYQICRRTARPSLLP